MLGANGLSVALLRPLAELLAGLGVDAVAFLGALGVDELAAPETYVAADEVDRQLEAIARRRGDPTFSLTLARACQIRPFSLLGHTMWLSETLGDSLVRATRFYGLITRRVTLSLDTLGDGASALRQHAVDGLPHGRLLTEFSFATLVTHARTITQNRYTTRSMHFSHAGDPATCGAYERMFEAPVEFDAPATALVFDTSHLALRIANNDPITSAVVDARAVELCTAAGHTPFVDQVRRVAVAHLGTPVSLAVIGRSLGVSPRTLRRRLEREGCSLRTLIDELRRERADQLLASGAAVKEIAYSLGFSEASGFSRAYKRWTGRSPRALG